MKIYRLDASVLSVRGNAAQFLQGLTTNSLDKSLNAFVNLHGRLIATCFQKKLSDDEFLLAVVPSAIQTLINHLDRYAKLSWTQLTVTDQKVYWDIDTDQAVFDSKDLPDQVSKEEFTLYRLKRNLPLMNVDYHSDEFVLNIDPLDQFVSYSKGCFLGQEPVAKVHNRSKPAKKLIVQFEDQCREEEKLQMTSKISDPQTGRMMGFVFVKNND